MNVSCEYAECGDEMARKGRLDGRSVVDKRGLELAYVYGRRGVVVLLFE